MRTLSEEAFLSCAGERGLGVDPQYPESAFLTYRPNAAEARSWNVPSDAQRRPYFLSSLLDLLGDWQSCYAWRHLGYWPYSLDVDESETVERQILKGLGLPLGTTEVIEFARTDRNSLLTLLFSTTVFGWSVGQDLYVVPDHTRYILFAYHEGAVHVEFREAGDIDHWVSTMAELGFPLPDQVSDDRM